ncbi:putative Transglycosylase family protein [metagenome]|uniref:Putative Transglycosylase family protein n=1 Tax=metagenome TaxID=256318 RepID=A0A2P2C847_9ZZZZ
MRREIGLAAVSLALLLTVPSAGGAVIAPAAAPLGVPQPEASVSEPDSAPLAPVYPPPVTTESGWAKTAAVTTDAVVDSDDPVSSVLLAAYQSAASAVPASCHLPMTLLAAIGQVESGNLAGRSLDAEHRAVPPVLGPVLNGKGFSAIHDTDDGVYDGDRTWDRAVGPMQFIPGTWVRFGADLDGDGERNPQDVEDAAGAAAAYLCYGGRDLATTEGLHAAVLSYNHSETYVDLVLAWKATYDRDGFGSLPTPSVVTRVVSPTIVAPTVPASPGQPDHVTPSVGEPTSAPPPLVEGTKEADDDPLVHPVVDPPAPDPTDPPVTDPTDPPVTDPTDPPVTDPTDPPVTDPTDPPVTEPPVTDPTDPPVTDPTDPPSETPTTPPECEPAASAVIDPETGLPLDDPDTSVDETCLPPCAEAAIEDPTVDPELLCEPASTGP